MQLGNNESEFLWHLLYLHFLKGRVNEAYIGVSSMYERALDFPANIESLLLEYWNGRDESKLLEIAAMSARQFCFDLEKHVLLVALLVEKGLMGIDEASELLMLSGTSTDDASEPIRRIFEVAWLLNQDRKDGIMSPQQDDLLANVLRNILREAM